MQKRSYGILVGIGAAVLISGILSTYSLQEAEVNAPTPEDFKETIMGIQDIEQPELGFGQVEKDEGAYSP